MNEEEIRRVPPPPSQAQSLAQQVAALPAPDRATFDALMEQAA